MAEVEAVEALPRWIMTRRGMIKINVHRRFFEKPFEMVTSSAFALLFAIARARFCACSQVLLKFKTEELTSITL